MWKRKHFQWNIGKEERGVIMQQYVITITRQFGSLGRPIAKELSELLGVEYYDRDIVEETAKKMGVPVSVISEQEEVSKSGFGQMVFPLGMGTTTQQMEIFNNQAKIINEIVDKESCIIVGRCSDYILRNRKNCMNVFIYAPYEARFRNCVDILKLDAEEARKMIAKVDKARDAYHKSFAKFLPSDYNHKDVMIDSSMAGIKGTANILAAAARERFGIE